MNNFTRTEFQHAFAANVQAMPGYQKRFIAFVTALGFKQAYEGTVASRNARFMNWIAERLADFYDATGSYPLNCGGGAKVDAFTDFIIKGEWIK
ncbi:hypothetical protein [Escherichia phage SRT8]|uniref:Uncharacterized protein n=1 Tax=Escherichia phage SRT8 TaxID=2496545 RepID=A0A2D1GPH6_9CAUD|nr:hypothetical protein FDI72_gp56 [Escherichia phage SRT8]ATN93833.1 hypothetical protein [Escherichia phage SRT8]